MTESDIIHQLTLGQRQAPERYGVGDDAALVIDNRVVTQDTMVENVHWDEKLSPADVGWKLVAINASDIGAMGGIPEWCTLSISIPKGSSIDWVNEFAQGMRQALKYWNIQLIGGDTTRIDQTRVVSMTMSSKRGYNWAWQHDAKVGDDVWVTGTLGDAAAGYFEHGKHPHNTALQRPTPPIEFANTIVHNKMVHALTDLSDGLKLDLERICARSKVGALIEPDALPASSVLYRNKKTLAYQTTFGEDYEYLFTASSLSEKILRKMAARHKTTIHKIGKITVSDHGVLLRDTDWPKSLFSHFD